MARQERFISEEERAEVRDITRLFYQLTTYRNIYAGQWEEAASLIDPDSRNTFYYGSYNFPGMKKTQLQVDSSGALALQQFCAIADSLITPKNRLWHGFESEDYIMQDRRSRQWLDTLRETLFDYRYRPEGNFVGQNVRGWKSLGAYGNRVTYIDELDTRWHGGRPGLRYRECPLGECFFAENHQGIVTVLVRWFRFTARQAAERFGEDFLPHQLDTALEQDLQTPFQFLHCVRPRPRSEYDPERIDIRGMPFQSHYVSIEGQCLVAPPGGYRTFPYAVARYEQMPLEVYGRGPTQLVLPALKTLNAQKSTFLKQGHRASDPVLLAADDGLIDFDLTPGAINKGAMSMDGKRLIDVLPSGNIEINEKMMLEERNLIENMFLTPLFKTLMQNPNMTATQVVELINERAMLVAPTLGRQHSEYVGNLVPREVSLLTRMTFDGKPILPPMPPAIREVMAYYRAREVSEILETTDTSPLAQQARSSQAAGALRTLDVANQIANSSGDTSVYDYFAMDRLIAKVGEINEMPVELTATPQEIAQKQKNRQAQIAREQQIQELPAKAAMIKAQAVASKSAPLGQMMQPQQQQGAPVAP